MNPLGGGRTIGGVLGRAQGAAAFSPLSLNPVMWFDASQITGLSDGAAVATWADSSGNNRTATQAVSGNQPAYKTGIVGGKPIVRFATDDRLIIAGNMAVSAITVFAVFRTGASIPAAQAIVNFFQQAYVRWALGATTTSAERNGWAGAAAGTGLGQPSDAFLTSTAYVQCWKKSSTQWTIYRNGVAGTAINDSSSAATAVSGIGHERAATNAYHFSGDIAEIIVYDNALSDANRQAVEAYLSAKYGIALAG